MVVRRVAKLVGELALVWLVAASCTAAFVPRGVGFDASDTFTILPVSTGGGIAIALPAAAACVGVWFLLRREMLGPLALASAGLLAMALILPQGLTVYFLPPPVALIAVSWLLWVHPDPAAARPDPRRP